MKTLVKIYSVAIIAVNMIGSLFPGVSDSMSAEKEPGMVFTPGNYTVKADLGLASEKRKATSKFSDLRWSETKNSIIDPGMGGWIVEGENYFWTPAKSEDAIDIPLVPDKSALRITDFEELHVDYQDLFLDNPSTLRMSMLLSGGEAVPGSDKSNKQKSRIVLLKTDQENKVKTNVDEKRLSIKQEKRSKIIKEELLRDMEVAQQISKEDGLREQEKKKQLKIVDTLDASSMSWVKKDYLYTAQRILGLPYDSFWHYNQSAVDTFVRRRFNLDLGSIEYVDLIFQSGMGIDPKTMKSGNNLFACNFRVGFGSITIPKEIWECYHLPKRSIEIDGRKGLRVKLGDRVRQSQAEGKANVVLEEVIFHLPRQDANQVVQHAPVEKIVLQEWDRFQKEQWSKTEKEERVKKEVKEWIENVRIKNALRDAQIKSDISEWIKSVRTKSAIPFETQDLSYGQKRLILNLRGLADQIGKNATINNMSLFVQPNDSGKRSGIHLRRAGMVKLMDNDRPLFLSVGEALNRRWGGPFFPHVDKDEKIEWVNVDSYLPFENRGWEKTNGLISVGGGEIKGENPFSAWSSTGGGLEIEGQGKWLEVDWPVHVRTGAEERFYLGIPEGVESVVSMRMEPRHGGQALPAVKAFPNLPVKINTSEIYGIKIRLELDGKPFRIVLKEMALFQPVVLTPAEALDTPQLVWEETPLVPMDIRSPAGVGVQVVNGRLTGTVSDSISWTTKVERKVRWIGGISIQNEGAWPRLCGLQLTLNFSTQRVERKICPHVSDGHAYIPAGDLFREVDSEERLQSITWKLLSGDRLEDGRTSPSIDMLIVLDGVDLRSIREDLIKYPLIAGNEQKLFPTSLVDIPAEDFLAKNHWTNLGVLFTGEAPESQSFNFQKHPYLHIKRVVFEKLEVSVNAPSSEVKHRPLPVIQPSRSFNVPRWGKFLLFALAVAALRREWKKDRLSSVVRWFLSADRWLRQNGNVLAVAAGQNVLTVFNKTRTVVGKTQRFVLMLYRLVLSQAMMVNRFVVIIVSCLALLTMRSFDDLSVREPVLWILSLFLFCVLWHELRWRMYQNAAPSTRVGVFFFGRKREVPWALRGVVVATVFWAIWRSLHGGNAGQIVSEMRFPLELLIYLYLPWMEWLVSGLWKLLGGLLNPCCRFWVWVAVRNHRIWFVVALGFYAIGVFANLSRSENYFFTFGAMIAIVAWRSLMLFARSTLEKRWPFVYAENESFYVAGLVLALVGVSLAFLVNLEQAAEQFATIGLYMLVMALIIKVRDMPSRSPEAPNSMLGSVEDPRA